MLKLWLFKVDSQIKIFYFLGLISKIAPSGLDIVGPAHQQLIFSKNCGGNEKYLHFNPQNLPPVKMA